MAEVLLLVGLLLWFVVRHPLAVVLAAVSLIVLQDFGTAGLAVLWGLLLAISVARETTRSERKNSDRVR